MAPKSKTIRQNTENYVQYSSLSASCRTIWCDGVLLSNEGICKSSYIPLNEVNTSKHRRLRTVSGVVWKLSNEISVCFSEDFCIFFGFDRRKNAQKWPTSDLGLWYNLIQFLRFAYPAPARRWVWDISRILHLHLHLHVGWRGIFLVSCTYT